MRRSNFTWRWFTDRSLRDRYPPEDWDRHAHTHVADLRATAARRRGDADVEALVNDLRGVSPEFAALWDEHEVAVRHADTKRIVHPEVGVVDLLCEVLTGAGGEQLVVLFARPGTDARAQLDLLRVIGTQDLAAAPSDR